MSAQVQEATPSGQMIKIMGVVSLVCGFLIVGTDIATKEPIQKNQETIMRETVAQLLPGVQKQVVYTVDKSANPPELKLAQGAPGGAVLVAGYDQAGTLIGIAIEASEQGYADAIRAMYVYSPEKDAIIGFKVLELRETPGLGDKITSNPEFQANFKELDAKLDASGKLAHPIVTVKHGTKKNKWEVDAISGATISSRAVGRMLNKSASDLLPQIRSNLDRFRKGN